MTKQGNYLKEHAVEAGLITVDKTTVEYWICSSPSATLNGYAFFKKRPVKEHGYKGILTYVPVHGGITYARELDKGMVYGFDTMHYGSSEYPITDQTWIKSQIEVMVRGILVAKKWEANYLKAKTNKGKARWAQKVQDVGTKDQRLNFGVMLNILAGEL